MHRRVWDEHHPGAAREPREQELAATPDEFHVRERQFEGLHDPVPEDRIGGAEITPECRPPAQPAWLREVTDDAPVGGSWRKPE